MSELLRLDLGCGRRCEPGFVGVDITRSSAASVICDLSAAPWTITACDETEPALLGRLEDVPRRQFKDESVDEVLCRHFLEHLDGGQRIGFMDELWRVLKPGARATIVCPHWNSARAVMDPTHKFPPVCAESFLYFNRSWRLRDRLDHYPIKCNFTFEFDYALDREVQFENEGEMDKAATFYNNVVDDILVVLTKRGAEEETPC